MMKKLIQAEALKYKHSALPKLTVEMAVASVLMAAVLMGNYFSVNSYNWWYMGMYPGLLGMIGASIGQKDRKKKNHTIATLPLSAGRIWDAKMMVAMGYALVGMVALTGLTMLAVPLLHHGLGVQFIVQPTIKQQLAATGLLWLTSLWQLPFCMALSQRLGVFLTFLINLALYMATAVFGALEATFYFWPGALAARVMVPVLGVLPNGLLAVPGSVTYDPALLDAGAVLSGSVAALVWLAVLWLLGRKYYERTVRDV